MVHDDPLTRWMVRAAERTARSRFEYLFDFGDRHVFDLRVVDVVRVDAQACYPRVVTSTGRPPGQYRDG